jgi:hypothetical protein
VSPKGGCTLRRFDVTWFRLRHVCEVAPSSQLCSSSVHWSFSFLEPGYLGFLPFVIAILIQLFRHFVIGSDESGDHVGESVSPIFLAITRFALSTDKFALLEIMLIAVMICTVTLSFNNSCIFVSKTYLYIVKKKLLRFMYCLKLFCIFLTDIL